MLDPQSMYPHGPPGAQRRNWGPVRGTAEAGNEPHPPQMSLSMPHATTTRVGIAHLPT